MKLRIVRLTRQNRGSAGTGKTTTAEQSPKHVSSKISGSQDDNLILIADKFLALCEQRQLEEAGQYLAPDAILVFPGGVEFRSLHDMVAAARSRYRDLEKTRSSYLVGIRESDGLSVVTSLGTLRGVAGDGREFDGIRYADMFVFRDGLISEQNVFNDLAERGLIANEKETT